MSIRRPFGVPKDTMDIMDILRVDRFCPWWTPNGLPMDMLLISTDMADVGMTFVGRPCILVFRLDIADHKWTSS